MSGPRAAAWYYSWISDVPFCRFSDSATVMPPSATALQRASKRRKCRLMCREPAFNGPSTAAPANELMEPRLWRFPASRSRLPGFLCRRSNPTGPVTSSSYSYSSAFAQRAPLICIIALLTACGTTALKPEPKLVSSVTSLPPVEVPIPVRCVDKVPDIPNIVIDPNATVLQRHYMIKETVLAYEAALIEWHALLLGCAAKEPKP